VRTQTLVKGAIVQIDAAPFKQWYQQHYGTEVGLKKKGGAAPAADAEAEAASQSNHLKRKLKQRSQGRKLDQLMDDQFSTGRLYAAISSRPGQVCRNKQLALQAQRQAPAVILQPWPWVLLRSRTADQLVCSAAALMATSWRAASWSST
jgi:small subunit ribosomal protein S8e